MQDGNKTDTVGKAIVHYQYDAEGNLTSVTGDPTVTHTADQFGNTSDRTTDTIFKIFLGQSRAHKITSTTHSRQVDGSTNDSKVETLNRFKSSGQLPGVPPAAGAAVSEANGRAVTSTSIGDTLNANGGYDNITTGLRSQGRGIYNESRNYMGLSKQTASVNMTLTNNFDLSWTDSKSVTISNYSANGILIDGSGQPLEPRRRRMGTSTTQFLSASKCTRRTKNLLKQTKSDMATTCARGLDKSLSRSARARRISSSPRPAS